MSILLPAAIRPPNLNRAVRMGRCAEGTALWLCPRQVEGVSTAMIEAWWDALHVAAGTLGFGMRRVELALPGGVEVIGWAFAVRDEELCQYPRLQRRSAPSSVTLDGLPPVAAAEPLVVWEADYLGPCYHDLFPDEEGEIAPPTDPGVWYGGDDDDDFRDIFEDYAELSGMSRDDWLLSVD